MWHRVERFVGRNGWLAVVARLLLGVVFLFSSVTKGVDPYGTVLKIEEYLVAMGLDFASVLSPAASVALISFEMLIGVALLVGAAPRITAIITLCFNSFYLLLTFWIALAEPVADCGCFGDILTLTNMQTLAKNVVLVLLSLVIFAGAKRGRGPIWSCVVALLMGVAMVAFTIYSLICLPVVERFPFGEGVNIPQAVDEELSSPDASRIVCRNILTGQEQSFAVNDSTWWDEQEWEYLRTETPKSRLRIRPSEFRLFAGDMDMTYSVLLMPMCRLVCVEDVESLSLGDIVKLRDIIQDCRGRGERVVFVSASPLREVEKFFPSMEMCNADPMLLRALLRAPAGIVTLVEGTILHKASLRALSR